MIGAALLSRVTGEAEVWDKRPDAERFSLREVVAHLVDWEPVWLDRVIRFVTEDHPFLPSVDEELLVIENAYESMPGSESLARYAAGRQALVSYLRAVPEQAWDRSASREFVGDLTLYQQVAMVLSHDGYHMAQIVTWFRA